MDIVYITKHCTIERLQCPEFASKYCVKQKIDVINVQEMYKYNKTLKL